MDRAGAGQAGGRTGRVVSDLPQHGPSHVISHVPAADHHHLATDIQRLAQRDRPQQLDPTVDPRPLLAGQPHRSRGFRPHGDDHRRILAPQIGQRNIAAHRRVAADLDSQRFDHSDLPRDQLTGQTVSRHTPCQHARRHRLGLEYHRAESHQRQIVRGGQSRRSGSDDRDWLAPNRRKLARHSGLQQRGHLLRVSRHGGDVGLNRIQHRVRGPYVRSGLLAHKPFERADRNRAIRSDKTPVVIHPRHLAPPACRFAGRPADAPADRRQGIRAASDQIGLLETAFGDRPHVAPRIRMHRTRHLTRDELPMVSLARHVDSQFHTLHHLTDSPSQVVVVSSPTSISKEAPCDAEPAQFGVGSSQQGICLSSIPMGRGCWMN